MMGYDYRVGGSEPGASAPLARRDGSGKTLSWSLDHVPRRAASRRSGRSSACRSTASFGPSRAPRSGAPATGRGEVWVPRRNLATLASPSASPAYDVIEDVEMLAVPDGAGWQAVCYDTPQSLVPKLGLADARGLAGAGVLGRRLRARAARVHVADREVPLGQARRGGRGSLRPGLTPGGRPRRGCRRRASSAARPSRSSAPAHTSGTLITPHRTRSFRSIRTAPWALPQNETSVVAEGRHPHPDRLDPDERALDPVSSRRSTAASGTGTARIRMSESSPTSQYAVAGVAVNRRRIQRARGSIRIGSGRLHRQRVILRFQVKDATLAPRDVPDSSNTRGAAGPGRIRLRGWPQSGARRPRAGRARSCSRRSRRRSASRRGLPVTASAISTPGRRARGCSPRTGRAARRGWRSAAVRPTRRRWRRARRRASRTRAFSCDARGGRAATATGSRLADAASSIAGVTSRSVATPGYGAGDRGDGRLALGARARCTPNARAAASTRIGHDDRHLVERQRNGPERERPAVEQERGAVLAHRRGELVHQPARDADALVLRRAGRSWPASSGRSRAPRRPPARAPTRARARPSSRARRPAADPRRGRRGTRAPAGRRRPSPTPSPRRSRSSGPNAE